MSAVVDEPPIRQPLLALQVGAGIEGFFRIEERHDFGMRRVVALLAFERIDVKPVDGQIVVERCLDRRKEAGSRRDEIGLGKQSASLQQAMIRPRAVIGHAQEMAGKQVGHIFSLAPVDGFWGSGGWGWRLESMPGCQVSGLVVGVYARLLLSGLVVCLNWMSSLSLLATVRGGTSFLCPKRQRNEAKKTLSTTLP